MPDPILCANIYASGLLDDVLERVVLPYRAQLTNGAGLERCRLWVVRYSRGGDHLKVRVHGEVEQRDTLRRLLQTQVDVYLASLRDSRAAVPRIIRDNVPAIDPEDEVKPPVQDRSLVWTTYRRSHITLGGAPWIEDDHFVDLAYECLSAACDLALDAVEQGTLRAGSGRQKALIKGLLTGVAALRLGGAEQNAVYIKHHVDVLLRFFVDETAKEEQLRSHFADRLQRGNTVAQLAGLVRAAWLDGDGVDHAARWPAAVAALAAYTGSFAGHPEYQVHPFTSNVTFPPAFKMFHGLANQLGMQWADEAFVHNLLHGAVDAALRPNEVAT
jgi:hypothetical protein